MRAFVMTEYGGPEVAEIREDVATPKIAANEVLVKVRAVGLNPVDYKIREGKLKVIRRFPLPAIMGSEVSGVIDAVGDGVKGFKVGERVFARLDKDQMGGLAEFVQVREEHLAKIPESMSFEQAAAVPLAALTALQALRDELRLQPGQKVFIPGGAGGVGTFAIQIGKALGAFVATTASPRGEALVKRLGADVVVDYTREKFQDVLKGYDGAFDLLGGENLEHSFEVVKRGGTVVSIAGTPEPETAKRDLGGRPVLSFLFWMVSRKIRAIAAKYGVKYRYLFMHPSGADLKLVGEMIDAKTVEVVVDRVFPFDDVKQAYSYLEEGRAKGKVVVTIP